MFTAACVFVTVLIACLLRHDTIGQHVLTPVEQLPIGLIAGVIGSSLALLGTWLGICHGGAQQSSYRAGLTVAVLYGVATFLANEVFDTGPRTVTFPSHEAYVLGREVLITGTLWGIGAPYLIAFIVSRARFFEPSHGA